MDFLRLITSGNVDDGKSALTGRRRCDTQSILEDPWVTVERASAQEDDTVAPLSMRRVPISTMAEEPPGLSRWRSRL